MAHVFQWSGAEVRVLRSAARLSVRGFAGFLGVSARAVSYWESGGAGRVPRPDSQAILDAAFHRVDEAARQRFRQALGARVSPAEARGFGCDLELWAEDLDRAAVLAAQQDFTAAAALLGRWMTSVDTTRLDSAGAELWGRSLLLHGDVLRDQGFVAGPVSAQSRYRMARKVFAEVGAPRWAARCELAVGVTWEMSGRLDRASAAYELASRDDHLSPRDRARALLWTGTVATKQGRAEWAVERISSAVRCFDEQGESQDWATGHQKLALAHRRDGDLRTAMECIEVATSGASAATVLQRVRLGTARGHILIADTATADDGDRVLDEAWRLACEYGLAHQRRSIESIRSRNEAGAD